MKWTDLDWTPIALLAVWLAVHLIWQWRAERRMRRERRLVVRTWAPECDEKRDWRGWPS